MSMTSASTTRMSIPMSSAATDMVVARRRGIVFGRGYQLRPTSIDCPKCYGTGYVDIDTVRVACRKCNGTGTYIRQRKVKQDGQKK